MSADIAKISGYNEATIGVVLVLFILLVVVTKMVCSDSSDDDSQVDINTTGTFEIRNASAIFSFNLVTSTSSRLPVVIRPYELVRFTVTGTTTAEYAFGNPALPTGFIAFRIVPGAADPFDRFRARRVFYRIDLEDYPELIIFPYS